MSFLCRTAGLGDTEGFDARCCRCRQSRPTSGSTRIRRISYLYGISKEFFYQTSAQASSLRTALHHGKRLSNMRCCWTRMQPCRV